MLQQLSLDEFISLAKTAKRVSVFKEILSDTLTPIRIFEALSDEMREGVMLESGMQRQNSGRYSFLAFDPIAQLRAKDRLVTQKIGDKITTSDLQPFILLRKLISQLSCVSKPNIAEYMGNAVGFITYDAVRLFETIPDRHIVDETLPDVLFNFYRTTLTFDHSQQKLLISMIADIDGNPQNIYQKTQEKITQLITKITTYYGSKSRVNKKQASSAYAEISDVEFMKLVERAKEYIIQGDAFQIVLSRCFKQQYTASAFDIYRALRKVSPAPYMFYFPIDGSVLVGASPESMISVNQGKVTINPIAGTRQRADKKQDDEIAEELLNDKKERAEHIMLVDLARNDIGAVCDPGSVEVSEFLQVKHYSHVSHLTSVVTGNVQNKFDGFDVLRAAFPAGTLSGAPKIRAMQIIDELETSRRGVYGGAICRFDYQGNFDSCIAIRMAVLRDGIATVRAGAGVVYDSNPSSEAQETRQKAKAMLDAITLAEEGLT